MASGIGWSFPSNNNGREDGLNDPGVETFRNDPLRSLSREGAQNSSDAPDPASGKPVEIHFELVDLPMSKFPDAERFEQILMACEKYWSKNEARKFFTEFSDSTVSVSCGPDGSLRAKRFSPLLQTHRSQHEIGRAPSADALLELHDAHEGDEP